MSEGSSKLPAHENPASDSDSDPKSVSDSMEEARNAFFSSSLFRAVMEQSGLELTDEVMDEVRRTFRVCTPEEDEVSMEEDEVSMEEDEEECCDRSTNCDLEAIKYSEFLAIKYSEFLADIQFEESERTSQNDGEEDYDADAAENKFSENDGVEIDKLSKNSNFEELPLIVELNPPKSRDPQFNYEKLSVIKDDAFTSSWVHHFEEMAEKGNPPDQEKLLESILIFLEKNREILWSRICSMEDELALHEETFERLSRGVDVGLDLILCAKYFVTCDINDLMPKNEKNIQDKGHGEQQTRLHDTFHEKSSCADLKDQCLINGWRLPRYIVEPSNGRFLSTVFVSSQGINLNSKGDSGVSPSEARESAAAKMINEIQKIRNTFALSK